MKKILSVTACWVCFFLLGHAGTYTRYNENAYAEYTGKYHFTDDAPVRQVEVYLKDTTLNYRSDNDSGLLTRVVADSFNFSGNYEGTVVFRRDASRRVTGQTVYVMGQVLEAEKEKTAEGAAQQNR
jgi:hypothetical protein